MIAWLRLEMSHFECDDCWYSCAKLTCDENRRSDVCDCGADEQGRIRKLIADELSAAERGSRDG